MTRLPSTSVKSIEFGGEAITKGSISRDPLKVKVRLYIQVSEMIRQLEEGEGDDGPISVRERIAALTAVGRLQNLLVDKGKDDDDISGSAVRKYASVFKNGSRRGKKNARPAPVDDDPLSDRGWDDPLGDP